MLNPLRAAARILTGSTYAVLGFDALRTPGGRVGQAATTLAAVRRVVPLPEDDELVVRGNAAVQAVAGTMLALGILPRPSALALAGSLVPTTMAGHAFWAVEDPTARKLQRVQFHKNLAMIGGLLFAALDEQPSVRAARARSTYFGQDGALPARRLTLTTSCRGRRSATRASTDMRRSIRWPSSSKSPGSTQGG